MHQRAETTIETIEYFSLKKNTKKREQHLLQISRISNKENTQKKKRKTKEEQNFFLLQRNYKPLSYLLLSIDPESYTAHTHGQKKTVAPVL